MITSWTVWALVLVVYWILAEIVIEHHDWDGDQ